MDAAGEVNQASSWTFVSSSEQKMLRLYDHNRQTPVKYPKNLKPLTICCENSHTEQKIEELNISDKNTLL